MLRGETSPGRFYRQHEEFIAALGQDERAAVLTGQPDKLEEVVVARYRAALAMGTLPPYADEVNREVLDTLLEQLTAALKAAAAAEPKAPEPLRPRLADNREALGRLTTALRNFVPGVNPAISGPNPPMPEALPRKSTLPHRDWTPPKKKVSVMGVALVVGALGLVALLLLARQLG